MEIYFFITITILLIISFFTNKQKTILALKKAGIQFIKILPTILSVIILVSTALHFIPQEVLLKYFGDKSSTMGYIVAGMVGSISLIPGFISYPLAGMLVDSGVSFGIIAMFITTLKMVGILTIPVEARYFGMKVTLMRNGLSLLGAIIIGLFMAFIFYIS